MPRAKKEGAGEPKKRSRTGCWPCKARKVKCGEERPTCSHCAKSGEPCDYSIRLNWAGRSRKDGRGNIAFVNDSSPGSGRDGPDEHVFSAQHISAAPPPPPRHRVANKHATASPTHQATPGAPLPRQPTAEVPPPPPPAMMWTPATASSYPIHGAHTVPYDVPRYVPPPAYHPPHHPSPSQLPTQRIDDFAWSSQHTTKRVKRSRSPLAATSTNTSPPVFAVPHYPAPYPTHLEPSPQSSSTLTPRSVNSTLHTPVSSITSPPPLPSSHLNLTTRTTPDLRRLSVKSLLSDDPSSDLRPTFLSSHSTTTSSTSSTSTHRTYGYDHGMEDLDIPRNDDHHVALPRSPDLRRRPSAAVSEDGNSTSSHDAHSSTPDHARPIAFEPGGYYASPVPIRLAKSLDPLPAELLQNQMNLLYFHHFLNHTGRILVPHDCPGNPFRSVLPQMAVRNTHLLHLVLAFSASHRARLLNHPEPANRIAGWMEDVLPALRHALDAPQSPLVAQDSTDPSSLAPLATAIMLASLEILSPSTLTVAISWQTHLEVAGRMIVARGGLDRAARGVGFEWAGAGAGVKRGGEGDAGGRGDVHVEGGTVDDVDMVDDEFDGGQIDPMFDSGKIEQSRDVANPGHSNVKHGSNDGNLDHPNAGSGLINTDPEMLNHGSSGHDNLDSILGSSGSGKVGPLVADLSGGDSTNFIFTGTGSAGQDDYHAVDISSNSATTHTNNLHANTDDQGVRLDTSQHVISAFVDPTPASCDAYTGDGHLTHLNNDYLTVDQDATASVDRDHQDFSRGEETSHDYDAGAATTHIDRNGDAVSVILGNGDAGGTRAHSAGNSESGNINRIGDVTNIGFNRTTPGHCHSDSKHISANNIARDALPSNNINIENNDNQNRTTTTIIHPTTPRNAALFFLSRWFAYLDVLGSLSSGTPSRPPLRDAYLADGGGRWLVNRALAEQDSIDCFFGFSGRCMALLAHVAELAARTDVLRLAASPTSTSPHLPAIVLPWQPPAFIRDETAHLLHRISLSVNTASTTGCPYSPTPPSPEALATNAAFHHAATLHLHRRVLGLARSSAEVQSGVQHILLCLQSVRRGSSAEGCLLFPVFVAGCEALGDGEREAFGERLRGVEGWGMAHVKRAREVMEGVWATGKGWEDVVRGEFFG